MTGEQCGVLRTRIAELEAELSLTKSDLGIAHRVCSRAEDHEKEAVRIGCENITAREAAESKCRDLEAKLAGVEKERDQWKADAKLRQQNSANEFAVLHAQLQVVNAKLLSYTSATLGSEEGREALRKVDEWTKEFCGDKGDHSVTVYMVLARIARAQSVLIGELGKALKSMQPKWAGPPFSSDMVRFFDIRDAALALIPRTQEN